MAAAQGFPVWYELMARDPAKVAPFYAAVLGWSFKTEGMDLPNGSNYRMITRPDGSHAAGLLVLGEAMLAAGAQPNWAVYFHTPDVDAAAAKAAGMGATIHLEPHNLPAAGRLAMLADPQGAIFYLITPQMPEGTTDEDMQSAVFSTEKTGYCTWNELNTDGADAQLAFYTGLFDWQQEGEMPMPGDHSYRFVLCGGEGIGAIGSMKPDGMPNAWLPYFRVRDITAVGQAILAHGGQIVMGPHDVPGGDSIIVAIDPDGAAIGLVAKTEE